MSEKISSLTKFSVNYRAIFIHSDDSLFKVFRTWRGASIVVI